MKLTVTNPVTGQVDWLESGLQWLIYVGVFVPLGTIVICVPIILWNLWHMR